MFGKIGKYLEIIRFVASVFPMIIQLLKAVEAEFPSKSGQEKLAVVRDALEGAFDVMDDLVITFTDVWPALEKVISSLVAAFNRMGIFTHDDK